MIKVLIGLEWFDEHVIYVDYHGAAKLVGEHLVDKSLVSCTNILQPKGQDFIAKDAPISGEYSLLLVIRVQEDLIVVWEGIHEIKKLMSDCSVD